MLTHESSKDIKTFIYVTISNGQLRNDTSTEAYCKHSFQNNKSFSNDLHPSSHLKCFKVAFQVKNSMKTEQINLPGKQKWHDLLLHSD